MTRSLAACIFALVSATLIAAETPRRAPLTVTFSNGVMLGFTSRTEPESAYGNASARIEVEGEEVVHRLFVDDDAGIYFGYDVRVEKGDSDEVKLTFLPLSSKPRAPAEAQRYTPRGPAPRFAQPQSVRAGDTVTLDVLVNPRTGVKIVDAIRVTVAGSPAAHEPIGGRAASAEGGRRPARSFSADEVKLTMSNAQLIVDAQPVGSSAASRVSVSGSLIWFAIPGHGRFVFSLTPREGAPFAKIALLDHDRISFVAGGRSYEWVSSAPVLRDSEGPWNLWVLHDATFGAGSAGSGGAYLAGAAGRVEHLLPRN